MRGRRKTGLTTVNSHDNTSPLTDLKVHVCTGILFIYVYRGFVQYEEIPSHSSADGCGETFRRILACVGA